MEASFSAVQLIPCGLLAELCFACKVQTVAVCSLTSCATTCAHDPVFAEGVNARRPEGTKEADFDAPPTQFHTIMQKLFPVLLSLACAADPVSRQLFEPLVMSLVHWLTRSARRSVPFQGPASPAAMTDCDP